MDLHLGEGAEAGQEADAEAEGVAAEGLEGVVEGGEAKKADVDLLHVREGNPKFHLGLHGARKGHVLDGDGDAFAGHALADADLEDDLGVDLGLELAAGQVVVGVVDKVFFPFIPSFFLFSFPLPFTFFISFLGEGDCGGGSGGPVADV